MTSRLRIPIPCGARFAPWLRLAAVAILVALPVLGEGSGALAQDGEAAGGVEAHLARFESTPRKRTADVRAEQREPTDFPVNDVLERGREVLDRYDAERVLLAVVVGALVYVLGRLAFRVVGAMLSLASRVVAWGLGVAVALALLDGTTGQFGVTDEAARWFGRLVDLIGLVA